MFNTSAEVGPCFLNMAKTPFKDCNFGNVTLLTAAMPSAAMLSCCHAHNDGVIKPTVFVVFNATEARLQLRETEAFTQIQYLQLRIITNIIYSI